MKRTVVLSLLLGCLLVVSFPCTAQTDVQSADTVIIDARLVPGAPKALPFPVGGTAPDGHKLYANRRYLIRDPWFPIVGEFHYSRYPEREWEQEILKIRCCFLQGLYKGVRIAVVGATWGQVKDCRCCTQAYD